MKLRVVMLLLWLVEKISSVLEVLDTCCYPECNNTSDFWCVTGGHRCCYEHETGFYSDVEFCLTCYESMSEEEIKKEIEDCKVVDE